ncbi:MAG: type II toxin-antitoxin system VapB family antitoxin [Spirochaetia bacterium]|jgi:Arc/MetJ family transcription regulator
MKMTIEIDEARLSRLMKLAGIRTKTAAVDWALRSAEHTVRREKLFAVRWGEEELASSVDPSYDVLAIRHQANGR